MYAEADKIDQIIKSASNIVIVQADNPDADSLGSALALESILSEMNKQTALYCAVDMPQYLRYMSGWDRLQKDLPKQFDASIIVDASTTVLFDKLNQSGQQGWLASKPTIVLDHHESVENVIPFAEVIINDHKRASTGELIYIIAKQLNWSLSKDAQEFMMSSILGDTQGLTNQLASSETYKIMAEMIENGVDRSLLEEKRREFSKMTSDIFRYKADLIKRTKFAANGHIAYVAIPQSEINQYSPQYNPAPLIQGDMLQITDVELAIVFKQYSDGRVTGAIRSNLTAPIAAKLAEHLGGGGHAFASGFRVADGRSYEDIEKKCLDEASRLIDTLK